MMVALEVVFKAAVIAAELVAHHPAAIAAEPVARYPAAIVAVPAAHPGVVTRALRMYLVSNHFRVGLVRLRLQLLPMRARRFGSWFQTKEVLPGPESAFWKQSCESSGSGDG